jgi:predicted RNA binding protein YcfA (HicA-like mRNA interferase family)
MPMKVREVIQLLEKQGWAELRSKGSQRARNTKLYAKPEPTSSVDYVEFAA